MAYIRHDKDNNPVSPQPGSTTVNQFSGNEGWSQVTYKNFNADYQAQKVVQAYLFAHAGTFQTALAFGTSATSGVIDEVEVGMYVRGKGVLEGTQITAINKDPSNYPNYWTVVISPSLDNDKSFSGDGSVTARILEAGDPITFFKNRTPGTYQARNADNSPRTPAAYQRHDKDNNPVTG